MTIPMVMPSSVAALLSLRFGFEGPCVTVSAACASGAAAIGEGVELLRRRAADVVLAGGVDSLVGYGAMCCFMRLDAQAADTVTHGPPKPNRSDRKAATELGMTIGMVTRLTPRTPCSRSLDVCSS